MVPIFVQIKELVQVAVKTWKREHLQTETLLRYLDTKRNYGTVMEYQKAARLALSRSRLHRSILREEFSLIHLVSALHYTINVGVQFQGMLYDEFI